MAIKSLTQAQLKKMLPHKDFVLIRTHPFEQPQIPGTDGCYSPSILDQMLTAYPDKNVKMVLYCNSGGTSSYVGTVMAGLGYTNVYNLEGGTDAWQE